MYNADIFNKPACWKYANQLREATTDIADLCLVFSLAPATQLPNLSCQTSAGRRLTAVGAAGFDYDMIGLVFRSKPNASNASYRWESNTTQNRTKPNKHPHRILSYFQS